MHDTVYLVLFVTLFVILFVARLIHSSRDPSQHLLESALESASEPATARGGHIRGSVNDPVAAIFTLGSDPSLHDQASQDSKIYRNEFHAAQARSIVNIHHLVAELASSPCHIAHVLNKFDDSGRVVWDEGEGDVVEVLKAFSDSGSYFVFLASNESREEVKKEIFRAHDLLEKPRFTLAILMDRGPEFAEFLREFSRELRRGKLPALAWLKVRPQDAGGPQPEVDRGPEGLLVT